MSTCPAIFGEQRTPVIFPTAPSSMMSRQNQIEPVKPMFPDVFKGALDNFARAALAKAYESARS